ncbi:helix-turn-helix domain-containing protein [Streptomyces sp. V4I2]|uniref:AraC-like ligand-binding domain-containing protein n=1 Tax=Streptomyces sp. V4I2 TaxID=3042280 RepID=UPI0027863306|nr:helix-turn-helix domain-containing protein [Streptomyces sp. V4I2]MDQ1046302.1 AraC family transcriptional activator of tynA and feaB [Streptomyces sp. V4I2]
MAVWDITGRPAHEQFGFWREVICEAFVPLSPTRTSPDPGFAGQVETRPLGEINRARIRSQPQLTSHGPREVSRSQGEFYFVNLQLAGRCAVRQGAAESVVGPGQFTVLDTTEPYYLDFDAEWRMLSFRLPRPQLSTRLPEAHRAAGLGRSIDGSTGVGSVVTALMASLWQLDDLDGSTPTPVLAELEQSFLSVVAATLGARTAHDDQDPHDVHAGTRTAILRFVAANLGDPSLSVATVCRRFAISPRLLHRLFEGEERSFAGTVRSLRLNRCARLLRDPRETATITDIAARHGYTDPASFSRTFRREFGISPREMREQQDGYGAVPR